MGQMAGVAGLPWCRSVAAAFVSVDCLLMAGQAEIFFIEFELGFAGRPMAVMACEALALEYRLVLADHFRLLLFLTVVVFADRSCCMTVEADHFGRFDQEQALITGMDRMAADALFVPVRFMDTAWSCHRFFMTVETQLIGRGLGGHFLLCHLVTGFTFALCHRFVQILFQEVGRVTCMRGVAEQAAALHRIVVVGLFEDVSVCLVTGAAPCVRFTGQE